MKPYYFTFGSDKTYPSGEKDYICIKAPTKIIAIQIFQILYPNDERLNYASVYTETEWLNIDYAFYKKPKRIIFYNQKYFPQIKIEEENKGIKDGKKKNRMGKSKKRFIRK